ncbi:restriction endonuclease subunit S [Phaeobacter inhibens]|uniref:restriction endonuclease subunit S n=1 Tax=Phaeobacter inhibens TaxID=221822 RepID=UPI0026E2FF67|nr:restriction endonuclease subunit S [Phaeobacter inhibens]MDO6757045.1 restriction endonuclease subunit S [Phaeobacter inhibens]
MRELPKGWEATTIGKVASKIGSGATPKGGKNAYKAEGIPLLRSLNVHFDGVRREGLAFIDDEQASKLDNVVVYADDVLLNITGASIGRVAIAPAQYEGARVNQHVSIIRPVEGVEPEFLSKFLASPPSQTKIMNENYGATRQALTKTMIEEFGLPLPPLAEQRRIVEKLDQLSARIRAAKDHLTHVQTLATRAKQATLAAAFRGELTADWRAQTDATEWVETSIDSLLDGVTAGKNLRCVEKPPKAHEIGVVKVSAVTWGRFDETQAKTLPDDFEPAEKTLIEDGDFLFSRANTIELVGACAIVEEAPGNLYLSDKVLRLEMDDGLKPWVMHYLRSTEGRDALEKASSGNQQSMRNISQKALKQIVVPLPPLEEQTEIVRRIEAAFARIDRMVAEAAKARALLERLEQQLLAKAFRGELVPQDPNDEPASALLARIREARANAPKPKRTRKKKAAS